MTRSAGWKIWRRAAIERLPTAISLAIIVPAGFYCKFYRGPAAHWANDSLAGAFYEVFWCLLAGLRGPRWRPRAIAAWVLASTCALEFLQLWHPAPLEAMRRTFLGAAILGTTFVWSDFPYYFLGSAAGWLWLCLIQRCTRGYNEARTGAHLAASKKGLP